MNKLLPCSNERYFKILAEYDISDSVLKEVNFEKIIGGSIAEQDNNLFIICLPQFN